MTDKTHKKPTKDTIAVSFRINAEHKEKWYKMAENDRRRPVNWLEVVIEKEWEQIKTNG